MSHSVQHGLTRRKITLDSGTPVPPIGLSLGLSLIHFAIHPSFAPFNRGTKSYFLPLPPYTSPIPHPSPGSSVDPYQQDPIVLVPCSYTIPYLLYATTYAFPSFTYDLHDSALHSSDLYLLRSYSGILVFLTYTALVVMDLV